MHREEREGEGKERGKGGERRQNELKRREEHGGEREMNVEEEKRSQHIASAVVQHMYYTKCTQQLS